MTADGHACCVQVYCFNDAQSTAAGGAAKGVKYDNLGTVKNLTALTTYCWTCGVECKPANDLHHVLCTFPSTLVLLCFVHSSGVARRAVVQQLVVHAFTSWT